MLDWYTVMCFDLGGRSLNKRLRLMNLSSHDLSLPAPPRSCNGSVHRRFVALSVALCQGLAFALFSGASSVFASEAFFEAKVRPILVKHCYECHSAEKTKGGLSLDSKAGWQKGGDSGPALIPGDPDGSRLIQAVRYHDPDMAMPPPKKSQKLAEADIEVLTAWVKMGAPDPRVVEAKIAGMKEEEARKWWAFQPLPKPDSHPGLDAFFSERWAAANLTPAPTADPRSLVRRMTYSLTGLPPAQSEVDAFVAAAGRDQPRAVAELVDRLLDSPQYGVQWGRHWLDVARYADTAGENTDRPLQHAWRYRNWVFDSFNRDLPYPDFIRRQIAGDLILGQGSLEERREGIVATGYLAIARRFGHDIEKDMHLTFEDAIDTLGKNFLGLTLGCARCHDHKYDPITAQDYYALYGILESSRFSFPGCEPKGQPRDMVPLIPETELEVKMKPWREKVAAFEAKKKATQAEAKKAAATLEESLRLSRRPLASGLVGEGQTVSFQHRLSLRRGEIVQLTVSPNASYASDTTRVDWTIHEEGEPKRQWSVADLVHDLMRGNPHMEKDGSAWCFLETTKAPVFLTDARHTISGNSALKSWSLGSEPSVFVNSADQQVMVWTTLQAESFFVHPGNKRPVSVAWISPIDGEVQLEGRLTDAHPSQSDGVSFALEHIAAPEVGGSLTRIGEISSHLKDPGPAPVYPAAYAVVDGKGANTRLHLRGDPEKKGDEVPRRWLSILGGDQVPEASGSGRRELADWIAQSPLAARVMVNRIWEWHFGRGLVRSSNDFGARGEKPLHPELLDWLASKFVESGFRVKSMHRLILNSAVYQRSVGSAPAEDRENGLFSRFNRRRLTAEELRDSLLVASGKLDLSAAEAHPFPPVETWKYSQHSPFNAVYPTDRRSAYLMVQRQRRHPFLSLFDGADPNATTPARQTTTVPTQALYFLNDPFFHEQAATFAQRILEASDSEERIALAWRRLFQRDPSDSERVAARAFLGTYPGSDLQKWSAYGRVLLASNEFLHVE
jgi:hypothetical protein